MARRRAMGHRWLAALGGCIVIAAVFAWLPLQATGLYPLPPSPTPTPPIPIPDGTPSCKASQLEAGLYGPRGYAGQARLSRSRHRRDLPRVETPW